MQEHYLGRKLMATSTSGSGNTGIENPVVCLAVNSVIMFT